MPRVNLTHQHRQVSTQAPRQRREQEVSRLPCIPPSCLSAGVSLCCGGQHGQINKKSPQPPTAIFLTNDHQRAPSKFALSVGAVRLSKTVNSFPIEPLGYPTLPRRPHRSTTESSPKHPPAIPSIPYPAPSHHPRVPSSGPLPRRVQPASPPPTFRTPCPCVGGSETCEKTWISASMGLRGCHQNHHPMQYPSVELCSTNTNGGAPSRLSCVRPSRHVSQEALPKQLARDIPPSPTARTISRTRRMDRHLTQPNPLAANRSING